jgi:DNA-binding LytR/AlgR family response regulator
VRIAICEDEKIHQEAIQGQLQKWAAGSCHEVDVSVFDNAETLLMLWEDVIFDVLILDIEMGQMSGMELAKAIRRIDANVTIIFVTSHASYSLEGYDVNPLHYLIKPLQSEKFHKVMDKALAVYSLKGGDNLVISAESGLQKIPPGAIRYIAMFSHNAEIFTADGSYTARTTLKELLRALPAHFINCHRSYVINMFKVDCAFNDHVVMAGGAGIPVSKARSKQVRELFIQLQTR